MILTLRDDSKKAFIKYKKNVEGSTVNDSCMHAVRFSIFVMVL